MTTRRFQSGITLIVSLIMLIVLTLLVVSAIRFSNINLRIAGNTQTQVEGEAAAQVAVEQTLELVKAVSKVDSIPTRQLNITTGGTNYKVKVTQPVCNLSVAVNTTQLDPAKPQDAACFSGGNVDLQFDEDGKPIPQPTECKDQNWEFAAQLDPATSGATAPLTVVQGVSMRVGAEVTCPTPP